MSGTMSLKSFKHVVQKAQGGVSASNSYVQGRYQGSFFSCLGRDVVLPFAFGAFMLLMIVKFGKKLVNRPQLRPDLSQPW